MKCADDMKTFEAAVMANRVYDFLAGLDDTYDKVHSHILQSDKVPSIENIFFIVCREAQRHIIMLGFGTKIGEPAIVFASKKSALASQHTGSGSSVVPPRHLTSAEKDKLKCDHYDCKAHVAVVATFVADITIGHGHITATPALAISSTPTLLPPCNSGRAFHADDTCDTGYPDLGDLLVVILAAAYVLLLGESVPKRFWMDVVNYRVYLLNRLPSRVLDVQTPVQVLTHHISVSSMLTLSPNVFGCVVYVHFHQNQRS
ncbi:hypothetical protein L3X38_043499 [Prunus dulcis]|uniref:Uncharacterized protein n=1 Tax=Prunus dulcis TaxID=3755 RepID=A0AAD4UXX5_PRUDU|nr:hypothetical protein L3X38_043499 [Prunus dulcis]